MEDHKSKFDNFTCDSYNKQYLSEGPLYQLLYTVLEKCLDDTNSMLEVGSGPNAPATYFMNKISKKKIDYTLCEPSKSAK